MYDAATSPLKRYWLFPAQTTIRPLTLTLYFTKQVVMTDFRFACRQLFKSPGFTLLALLTLALGIGLNTAIFSLINDLFLRGLPFKEPQRVLHITAGDKSRTGDDINLPIGAPRFMHYRDGQTVFSGFAGENGIAATLTGLV